MDTLNTTEGLPEDSGDRQDFPWLRASEAIEVSVSQE